MKSKRVLFINSEKREITETTVSCLEDMQKLVGGYIERAHIFENGDEVYVNEEGLLLAMNFFFRIRDGHQPFAGNAYVIGQVTPSGNNRSAITTVEELRKQLQFFGEGSYE